MRFVAVKLGDGEEVRLEKKITDKKWNINYLNKSIFWSIYFKIGGSKQVLR